MKETKKPIKNALYSYTSVISRPSSLYLLTILLVDTILSIGGSYMEVDSIFFQSQVFGATFIPGTLNYVSIGADGFYNTVSLDPATGINT